MQDWPLLPLAAYAAFFTLQAWHGRDAGLVGWRLPGRGRGWIRATALLGAAFLASHLWHLALPRWLGQLDAADVRPTLVAALSSTSGGGVPLVAAAYLLGTAAVCFHMVQSVMALKRPPREPPAGADAVSQWGAAGLALSVATGALAIIALATGSPRW